MMKFLIISVLIAVISAHHITSHFHPKTAAEITTAREACWEEFHISDSLKESMKKFEYPDEKAVHDAIKCIGTKLDLWSEHEGFHKDDLITQFGEEATTILDKCLTKHVEGDTVEKWAWHDWKCVVESGLKETIIKKLEISAHHHFHPKTAAEITTAREACWEEFHVSDSLKESMKKFEYPDEKAVHDAIKCIGTKLDLWSEHEGFHKDDLITQFGEEATTILDKCLTKHVEGDTVEKWAWHDWKCVVESGLKETIIKKLEVNNDKKE